MTREDYFSLARDLASAAGVPRETHAYFELHRDRLWETIAAFEIPARRFKHVLCVGPFFDYTPFLYRRDLADAVSVLEADQSTEKLEPLYRQRGIEFVREDLTRLFSRPPTGRLPWADQSFDLICCWETMEHFNFNPVPFVREMHRLLQPGGWFCATVPNLARLNARLSLLFGRGILTPVDHYQKLADQRTFGLHWREYTLAEFSRLFESNQFEIAASRHLRTFQDRPLSIAGKMKRLLGRAITKVRPSFGAICAVKAVRQ